MADEPAPDPEPLADVPMHIRDAPFRVQREYYRRARWMSALVALVLAVLAALLVIGLRALVA